MGYTEEQRKGILVYNFTVTGNDRDLLDQVIEAAKKRDMEVAENSDPEEILGVDPRDITKDYAHTARFSPHPTLQEVWELTGDIQDRMKIGVKKPNGLAPSGNIPGMVFVIQS